MSEMNRLDEILARGWIACDPNRSLSADDQITSGSPDLVGKPNWHWFLPRAHALKSFLSQHGYKIVKDD